MKKANYGRIEVKNFSFWYGNNQILKDISFVAEPNTITAIIGPSGCGKSTLIRSINRLNELIPNTRTRGDILLDNKSIYSIDVLRLRLKIGIVFQKPIALTGSIYDNVAIGPRLYGIRNKKRLDEIVEKSLVQAFLWKEVKNRLNAPASNLSGGQKQRLAIARLLTLNPKVLLLDESTASLDPASTQQIEDLLYELKAERTIIIVTHNMQQAARISDKTLFLLSTEEGEPATVVEFGPTELIFTRPEKEQTELYITGRFG